MGLFMADVKPRGFGLRQGATSAGARVVSPKLKKREKKKQKRFSPTSFQPSFFFVCVCDFLQAGVSLVWPAASQRLCKNSPSAVVIDAAALWRQLGQAGSLQPRLPTSPLLRLPRLPEVVESARVPFGCGLLFLAGRKLSRSGLQGS